MEIVYGVVGVGVIGLVGVAVLSALAWVASSRATAAARRDRDEALHTGAMPASLHPKIDPARCIGSGSCVKVCPEKDVLAVLDGLAQVVNPTACIGHGECLRACPVDAIQLVLGAEKRGVDIPMVGGDFQTNVPGLYIVGELGGMGLIINAMTQGMQAVQALAKAGVPKVEGAHQVVVVGAGPAGIAATLQAMAAKLDVLTVDQDTVGGTVMQYPRHKLVMTRPVALPLYGPLKVGEIRKEALVAAWRDVIDKTGLTVRENTRVASITKGDDGLFTLEVVDGPPIRAARVVLALGRRGTPRKLGVPGEELAKVTYRLIDADQYRGARVLVVGGGDSAVEAAVALGEAGATVHLSYRQGDFGRCKKKNRQKLEAAEQAGQVSLVLRSQLTEIREQEVSLTQEGEAITLPNDYALIFAGGELPTAFLKRAGVVIERFEGQAFAPANR